jgi:hypothetical protein
VVVEADTTGGVRAFDLSIAALLGTSFNEGESMTCVGGSETKSSVNDKDALLVLDHAWRLAREDV